MKSHFSNSNVKKTHQGLASQSLEKVLDNHSLGFHQITTRQELWDSCESLALKWKGQYDQIVVIGIGGSSLGPQVIKDCFHADSLLFFENVDPQQFQYLLKKIKSPLRTAWICSSKSGSTIETLCIIEALKSEIQDWGKMVAVVSEKKSNPLTDWALNNGYPVVEIPLDVGGRFSVLTPVGMLPAALLGLNLRQFQEGAKEAIKQKELISQCCAQMLESFDRQEWITVFWFYTSSGISMGRWVQQLWAESLGKKESRNLTRASRASTPVLAMGSVDQHSTLQQMMDGEKDKYYWFFRFQDLEAQYPLNPKVFPKLDILQKKTMGDLLSAQALATEKALNETGASSAQIHFKKLDEFALGQFFMMMQLLVATLAEALNLNAFDQPGVERGKILTLERLRTK